MSSDRTIPDRDTIARALFTWDTDENPHPPTWSELTNNQRDVWRSGADAMLALLADQPTVAQVREQALRDYAEAHGIVDSTFADRLTEARAQALNDAADSLPPGAAPYSAYLRNLAARERGESR